ncbi:homoserine kinase [Horticoccus luteus]|uniref:Homoserine kinase n=1 Tax=Horticoccus luteus TaxID=2862869 RepID=A0A8F9TXW2_9BACT|nr:homoserine kinase [Horticoccus luteus]QYM80150.1 homoserine kinase [Horticoccus luteus]
MKPSAREAVTVRVPGSTSNCGAGFDTLGLAAALYNRVTLRREAGTAGRAATPDQARGTEMANEAAEAFFHWSGRARFGFTFAIEGDVPPARGLGSSVTVRAGVLAGLGVLAGAELSPHDLVGLVTALEGHPDNAAASVLGGFCVSRCDPATGAFVDAVKIPVAAQARLVVASPEGEMLTKEARGILPKTLPYFDAVRSINSATYLVALLATGDYARLPGKLGDFMHEPYRLPLIRGAEPAIEAGVAAGAWTGWLSGSGSSVLCMADAARAESVAAAMRRAFAAAGVAAMARVLRADNDGLRIEA